MRIWCQLRWYFIHCMGSFLRHDQLIIRLIGCCHGPDINMDDVALEAFTTDLDKIMITMTLLISMTIPLFMCNLWNPNLHLSNPFQFLIFMSLHWLAWWVFVWSDDSNKNVDLNWILSSFFDFYTLGVRLSPYCKVEI